MDSRVIRAKELLDSEDRERYDVLIDALEGAVKAYEESLRVNVGLVNENAALRAKARAPETIDLGTVSGSDLLAEIQRRIS